MLTNSSSCPKHQTGKKHVQLHLRRHKIKTAILERQEDSSVDPHFFILHICHMNTSLFFKCDMYVWPVWDFDICRYVFFFSQMSNFKIYDIFKRICSNSSNDTKHGRICHTGDSYNRICHTCQESTRILHTWNKYVSIFYASNVWQIRRYSKTWSRVRFCEKCTDFFEM